MPQSLSRILIHLVFSTKNCDRILTPAAQTELHPYLAGVLDNIECPSLQVGGVGVGNRSISQKHSTNCCYTFPHSFTIFGISGMKLCRANWAILGWIIEIFLQRFQRELVASVANLCLGTERRDCHFSAIHKTRDREQHVVGILWKAPSGWSTKRIQFEHEQRANVGNGHFAFLLRSIEVASFDRHDSPTGQRPIDSGNYTGNHIIHDSSARQ